MAKSELEKLQDALDKANAAEAKLQTALDKSKKSEEKAQVAQDKAEEKATAAEGKIAAAETAKNIAEEAAKESASTAEAAEARNEELEKLAEKNPARDIVVNGKYKSIKHKKTVGFKDGYKGTRDLKGVVVNSEDLLAAASDKDYSSEENNLTHEGSVKIMDRLIKMDYAGLEPA